MALRAILILGLGQKLVKVTPCFEMSGVAFSWVSFVAFDPCRSFLGPTATSPSIVGEVAYPAETLFLCDASILEVA